MLAQDDYPQDSPVWVKFNNGLPPALGINETAAGLMQCNIYDT